MTTTGYRGTELHSHTEGLHATEVCSDEASVYKIGKSRVQKIGLTSDHFPGRRVLSFQNLLGKYELSIQVKIKLDFRNCFSRAKM